MAEKKAGRYELLEELGRGAMGVVWKGHDPMIGRTVAVKTMKLAEEVGGQPRPELVTRFHNETRAAGLLTHPNIVVIYDAGEEGGTFYITMEFIEGRSLQALLDQKQIFPIPRIMKIMEQACGGLGYAHQHNVIHRDVKPANIMLTPDDTVKITDFGMAKILQLGTTQTGQIVGTPSYMSPEQIKGKPVDGRSDIFSLGVMLYELVTGEKPFPGSEVTTVIYKIVHEDPIAPLELDSSVHPGLNHVITKALEKDPDRRYQTCYELLDDLRRFRDLGSRELTPTVVMLGRSPFAQKPSPPALEGDPEKESPTVRGTPVMPLPPAPARQVDGGPARQIHGGPARPEPAPPPAAPTPPPSPRSTTTLPHLPYTPPEPAPPRRTGHIWMGLLLIVLLGVGGYLLWPTFQQLQGKSPIQISPPAQQQTQTPEAQPAAPPETQPEAQPALSDSRGEAAPEEARPEETERFDSRSPSRAKVEGPPPAAAEKPSEPPAKIDPSALQKRIEQRLARAGYGGKVRVDVNESTVTFSGSLKPAEHRRLRQQLRSLAGGLKVDDRIEVASAGPGKEDKPQTAPGRGEVEVVTDVMGAQAVLKGPEGQPWECKTPCRFEELPPGRYTMAVTLAGYRPINRIFQVQAGRIHNEELAFQPYAAGISIMSRPPKADIYVDGKKRPEQTPATLNLPPGRYTIRVTKPGYEGTEQTVQLAGDSLQQLNVQLVERPEGVGVVEVRTVPPGAVILINGNNSGRRTPFTMQLTAGRYTLTLYLKGYRPVTKELVVEPGQRLALNEILPPQ